jgi:hypothetical protein
VRVYNTGEKAAKQPSFIVSLCPARHLEGQEVPSEFVNHKNEPLEINVEFIYGKAEVSDALGRYMLKHGFASKTSLIIPDRAIVA